MFNMTFEYIYENNLLTDVSSDNREFGNIVFPEPGASCFSAVVAVKGVGDGRSLMSKP